MRRNQVTEMAQIRCEEGTYHAKVAISVEGLKQGDARCFDLLYELPEDIVPRFFRMSGNSPRIGSAFSGAIARPGTDCESSFTMPLRFTWIAHVFDCPPAS
jgi:hypothetical protein